MRLPIEIDGSRGEGGGQVLRTALALAIVTGRKLRVKHIRAGRGKPGLQRQHLACVEAAAKLCGGRATGADGGALEVGADALVFVPGSEWAELVEVDIGSAGSTMLVVQTLLVPAFAAGRAVRAVITGGTHNPLAPPFEFLQRVFLPHVRAMGGEAVLTLERPGFMPRGGGRVVLEVTPSKLRAIEVVERGELTERRVTAICAGLPRHIGEREVAVAAEGLAEPVCEVQMFDGEGPQNLMMIELGFATGAREIFTSHGQKGYPAEDVAEDALDEMEDFLEAGVPVGEHLADQLLLPMAVAGGGRFRTLPLSDHAETNLATIREFLDVPIRVVAVGDRGAAVDVVVG